MSSSQLAAGPLRACFFRRHDRFAHRLEWVGGHPPELLIESLEGADQDAWPPSPPLQSLHLEERPGSGPVALLVGMAGRSHWSLSVEADRAAGGLLFDVACRAAARPEFLGTCYRTSPGWSAACSEEALELRGESAVVEVRRLPPASSAEGDFRFQTKPGGGIALEATGVDGPFPRTFRWRYRVTAR